MFSPAKLGKTVRCGEARLEKSVKISVLPLYFRCFYKKQRYEHNIENCFLPLRRFSHAPSQSNGSDSATE